MWSTQKDTGKTMAQVFLECGLGLVKANNSRVQGWMAVKELMKPTADGRPGLMVFASCKGLIDDLMAIQHDEKNPSDCAKTPHELTHRPDALRYFCQLRTMPPEQPEEEEEYFEPRPAQSYDDYMTGGDLDESYLCYSR
jgi:phage terminase large subunit